MPDFMRIKYENPKLKQSEIADRLDYSSSTLKRCRKDINMLSLYRNQTDQNIQRSKRLQIQILITVHFKNKT